MPELAIVPVNAECCVGLQNALAKRHEEMKALPQYYRHEKDLPLPELKTGGQAIHFRCDDGTNLASSLCFSVK